MYKSPLKGFKSLNIWPDLQKLLKDKLERFFIFGVITEYFTKPLVKQKIRPVFDKWDLPKLISICIHLYTVSDRYYCHYKANF